MAYRLELTKTAKREFDELERREQGRILEAFELLQLHPFSALLQSKKLRGAASLYRIRVGDYRVVYEVRNQLLLVVVIKIGHRREVYRR